MNIPIDQNNAIAIGIPTVFAGGAIIFNSDCVIYQGKRIYYRDVTKAAYHAVRNSRNFIPDSQTYSFMIGSEYQSIDISWGMTLYIGNKRKEEVWKKIVGIIVQVIQPHLIENLVQRIFLNHETLRIGTIEFSREGYSVPKLFRGRKLTLWSDPPSCHHISNGTIQVCSKGGMMGSVSLSEPNAVILPDLVNACLKMKRVGGQAVSQKAENKSDGEYVFIVCSNCKAKNRVSSGKLLGNTLPVCGRCRSRLHVGGMSNERKSSESPQTNDESIYETETERFLAPERKDSRRLLSAKEVLAIVSNIQPMTAQWTRLYTELNPTGDQDVHRLLGLIKGPHAAAPHTALGVIETGCEVAISKNVKATVIDALKAAIDSLDPFLR